LHQPQEALAITEKETCEECRLAALAILDKEIGRRVESDATVVRPEEKYASTSPRDIAIVRAYRGEADATFK
jgi:hypothetical protein